MIPMVQELGVAQKLRFPGFRSVHFQYIWPWSVKDNNFFSCAFLAIIEIVFQFRWCVINLDMLEQNLTLLAINMGCMEMITTDNSQ